MKSRPRYSRTRAKRSFMPPPSSLIHPWKYAVLSFRGCALKLVAKVARGLVTSITLIDGTEHFRAHSKDADRGVPSITAGARLARLGQIDLDLSKLGRNDGRTQVFKSTRRLV